MGFVAWELTSMSSPHTEVACGLTAGSDAAFCMSPFAYSPLTMHLPAFRA